MKKEIQPNVIRALIASNSYNEEERSIEVVASTGMKGLRYGWEENYYEELAIENTAIRLDRFNNGAPVLNSHSQWKLTDVLGKIERAWIENGELRCKLVFSKRDDIAGVIQDIKDGIITNLSVGYRVFKYEKLTNEAKIPTYRAIDWEPFEVSFVPVPFDYKATVRSEENQPNEVEIIVSQLNIREMENEPVNKPAEQVDTEKVRAEAVTAERKRASEIMALCKQAKLSDEFARQLIEKGESVENAQRAIIEEWAKKDEGETRGQNPEATNVTIGKEAIEKKREAAVNAVANRLNPVVFKIEGQNEFRHLSMSQIATALASERGLTGTHSNIALAEMIFEKRANSTSDFPLLLESLADKMLRADYNFAPEYWSQIARRTSNQDFRAKNLYKTGTTQGMNEIPEGGEIKYGTLQESKQTIKVKKYAEGMLFTREAFINDDLGAFEKIPSKFVLDWNTLRGDLVWGMLTANTLAGVKMDDGKELFHADHNNAISGATTNLSDDGLTAALLKFRAQTDLDGKRKIRVAPSILIVPTDLEVTAKKLLTTITPLETAKVNVWANSFNLIVEPRLSAAKVWYLAADPNSIEGLYYSYLQGNENLRSNRVEDFDTDSIKFAVRGEFGVAAIDFRGWLKSKGEA